MKQPVLIHVVGGENVQLLPWLSWLEREAVNLKVGSWSLPGSASRKLAPCGRMLGKTGNFAIVPEQPVCSFAVVAVFPSR